MKVCALPGCPALTPTTYCPEHTYRNGSTRAWRTTRARILARDNHRCTDCGSTTRLEVDHTVPLIYGGTDDDANLSTRCATHHRDKTTRDLRVGAHP